MKIDMKTTAGALALVALVYTVGKRNAQAAAGTLNSPVQPSNASSQAAGTADWWTYAGSWHM